MRKTAFSPLEGGDPGVNWLMQDMADYASPDDAEMIREHARPWERYEMGVAPKLLAGIGGAALTVAASRRFAPKKTPFAQGLKESFQDMGPSGYKQIVPRTKARFSVQRGGNTLRKIEANLEAASNAADGTYRIGATIAPPVFAAHEAWKYRNADTREARLNDLVQNAVDKSRSRA